MLRSSKSGLNPKSKKGHGECHAELQVSFAKEPCIREDILQKRPIIFKERTNRSHPIQARSEHGMDPYENFQFRWHFWCNEIMPHEIRIILLFDPRKHAK